MENKTSIFKKIVRESLPQMVAFIGAILFFFLIFKLGEIMDGISRVLDILTPIIIGIAIAYLLNPIVKRVEGHLEELWKQKIKKPMKKESGMRYPAIILTFIFLGLVIYLLAYMVFPQIYKNVYRIVMIAPGQLTKYYYKVTVLVSNHPQMREIVQNSYQTVMEFITGWLKQDFFDQLSLFVNKLMGVAGALSNFVIGIIIAIYLLSSKETFSRQFNLILKAYCKEKTSNRIRSVLKESDHIFGGFISGKIIDSLIIGAICFVGALILRLPYPALVSVIVGITNIIPFFGPYIGAVPSFLIIFLESPTKALIFLVFVILLQQFDGSILGPKILGESTGLSPFWVMFAILLGGGLFGLLGMLLGVPTLGVIYYLLKNMLYAQLERKGKGTE